MSIEVLAPMIESDLNKNKSPTTKPIIPERLSQNHENPLASVGTGLPRNIHANIENITKARYILIMFTENEPILLHEYSKQRAVNVQHTAVAKAASSPYLI